MFKFKFKFKRTFLKDNFTGFRQNDLKSQARKHRIQGVLLTLIIVSAVLIAAGYFLWPKLEDNIRTSIQKEIDKEMVVVSVTKRAIDIREHIGDNVIQKKIKKEDIPKDALVTALSSDYIFKRTLSENEIITNGDVIKLTDLIPDSRRYQEYNGVIDVPSGIEEYRNSENSEPLVVDVRYQNLSEERNEVILSKKELPLLIGSTIWFEIEDERERKLMDSAMKEKQLDGGTLILTIYTDPVIQEKAEVTYIPLDERDMIIEDTEGGGDS